VPLDDYLALEEPLVQRVRSAVPEFKAVVTAAELTAIEQMRQQTPAAIVVYDGDAVPQTPESEARDGERQIAIQRWLVVIAVQNVRDTRGGTSARREAGPLMSKTMAALKGWQPPVAGVRKLRRGDGVPGPAFDSGFGYFPLLFLARVMD
jgi:hypothetical protein